MQYIQGEGARIAQQRHEEKMAWEDYRRRQREAERNYVCGKCVPYAERPLSTGRAMSSDPSLRDYYSTKDANGNYVSDAAAMFDKYGFW